MARGPSCALSSPFSRQPIRWMLLWSEHLRNRSASLGFHPSLRDGPSCGLCPAGSGEPARGRGLGGGAGGMGECFSKGEPSSTGCKPAVTVVEYQTLGRPPFRGAILHLASPQHLAKVSSCVSALFKLAQPGFHHPRLLLPVADNGWCRVTQLNRSALSLDHPSHC